MTDAGPRVACARAAAAALVLVAASAAAHGGPASVEVVSVNPAAPERMAVSTNYGLASTSDGGATWSLTCEAAIGDAAGIHPRVVVTSDGGLVAGSFTGISRSDPSGCDYALVRGSSGHVTLDLQRVPGHPRGVIALVRREGAHEIWRSDDDGLSWTQRSVDFGPKFLPRSVAATSASERFYVGGLSDVDGFALLMTTVDGGETFSALGVPDALSAPDDAVFVEAVDPDDPLRLVAALYEPPSKVLLSADGGQSWTELFEGYTVLTGLAVSPGFDAIVTGSPAMGLWRVDLDGDVPAGEPQQVSDLPIRCLTWTPEALLVCADDAETGYAVGRSTDGGATVEPLLELRCLTRPACDASSGVEHACASEWPTLVDEIGIESCDPDPGPGPTASASSGVGGLGGGGMGGAAGARYTPVGGCAGCAMGRAGPLSWPFGVVLALIGRRRRGR